MKNLILKKRSDMCGTWWFKLGNHVYIEETTFGVIKMMAKALFWK